MKFTFYSAEMYSEPDQTSKIEFSKKKNSFQFITTFAKGSILDV